MNKNNRKKKGLSKRVLALMLCCFCLLATIPISAFALETGETQIAEESISEQQSEISSEAPLSLSSETSESQTEADTQQSTSDEIIEPILENETDTEVEAEVDSETGTEVNPETETETDTADSETEAGTEAEVNTETETNTEPETDDAGSETETDSETEVNAETGTEAKTGAETDVVESEIEADTATELNTVNETEELSFCDQLMAAESCQEIFNLMMSDTDACLMMSANELAQLKEKVNSMDDDGYQVDVLDTIAYLEEQLGGCTCGAADGEEHDTSCPLYEIGYYADNYYLDVDNYYTTPDVLWDAKNPNAMASLSQSQAGSHISSVTLAGITVNWSNSSSSSPSSGSTLATYYSGITAGTESFETLSIVAEEGYYVTKITIACDPVSGATPYNCSTWSNGEAFIQTFDLTESTYSNGVYTLSISASNKYFSHNAPSAAEAYYILIETAQVPTPLYVEYNYGNVTDFLTVDSDSAFYNPTWTVKSSSNNYGTGSVYTNDTQFAYGYSSDDVSVISSWSHTANSISSAALAEAADAGYYFAGWDVTWYNDCSISDTDNAYRDDYTMSFSDVYMTGSYQPGASVQLPTHVRLVAQWVPISLKMTKTVSGLSSITEFVNKSQTYTLLLQNQQNGEYVTLQTTSYTISGDGTLTYTFAASGADVSQIITPGTYKVVETGSYDLTGSTDNAYCTTTYPVQTVEVTADGTVKELQVLNTYSSTPATYDLTVQKTVSGNMYDANKEFAFTVTYGGETKTFNLKKDGSYTIENIPVGVNVTVTESPDGYTYSFVSITEGVTKTDTTNGVSFTMASQDVTVVINNDKTVTVDTGILLDTLPYILILGVVAVGAVLLIKKRRNRDDD